MLHYSHILLALLTSSLALTGCQNRAPSLRMLDTRAGYDQSPADEDIALYQGRQHSDETLVRQSAPRAVKMFIYPHKLPSNDWFLGGFVRLDVTQEQWVFDSMDSEDEETGAIREVKKPSKKSKKSVKTDANS